MSQALYMVRLVLDRRELIRVAADHRLPHRIDDGYLHHAGLAQLFASGSAPAKVPLLSFALDDTNPRAQADAEAVYLLAYSYMGEAELTAAMGPSRLRLLRLCSTRAVPPMNAGTLARFRTRVCPVVRTKRVGERPLRVNSKGRTISREVDAWLTERFASWQSEPPHGELAPLERQGREWIDRERVYADWLRRELARHSGCALEPGTRMESFAREVVHRGDRPALPRRGSLQRPNVVLEGTLRVSDPDGFRSLLARGIGRHRAFGFGMLLLRPA